MNESLKRMGPSIIIATIAMIACLSIMCYMGRPRELPAGYTLEVNDLGDYRWVDPDGGRSSFGQSKKKDAILAAIWMAKNDAEFVKRNTWRIVE